MNGGAAAAEKKAVGTAGCCPGPVATATCASGELTVHAYSEDWKITEVSTDRPSVMTSSPQTFMPRGDAPLLPSFEEQDSPQNNRGLLNPKTRRIRWTLDGPLETAIAVARDFSFDPDEVPEPSYQGVSGDDRKPTWHPFAQSPLTKLKVSSLKLSIDQLDDWDSFWMEVHEGYTDPDGLYDSIRVLYRPMPSVDETWRTEEDSYLFECCGLNRP